MFVLGGICSWCTHIGRQDEIRYMQIRAPEGFDDAFSWQFIPQGSDAAREVMMNYELLQGGKKTGGSTIVALGSDEIGTVSF